LSFFDEADEPRTEPRRPPRTAPRDAPPRRRRPSGSGTGGSGTRGSGTRPPRTPTDRQAIQTRRAIAALAIVIVLILIVLGVHSCQVSQRNSSLKDYNNSVSSIMQQSVNTGKTLFGQLTSGSSNATALQNQINEDRVQADAQLSKAQGLSVPDEMKGAQQDVLLSLQQRRDGIADTAKQVQPALGQATRQDAINALAVDMARFYSSDVVYKLYAGPLIAGAFKSAGIGVGGANGQVIYGGQFLPDVQWVLPSFIASQLHVTLPSGSSTSGKPAPGTHGHSLDSVSVGGNTLQASGNTLQANPAPTFTLNFTNGGQNAEHNVLCKVSLNNTSVSGQTTVPQTSPNQSASCNVQLSSAPSPGSYTLTATIGTVPGEKNASNNTLSFPVTFQ
jgi:hypothetical protein